MRSKPLIITLAVLVILAGIYGVLLLTSEEEPEPPQLEEGELPPPEKGEITLTELQPNKIMFLSYELDGQRLDFRYTVHGWQLRDDENFPVNQQYLETMVNTMCDVTSDRLLTSDRSKFADFGLEPAHIKVEMEDSEGNKYAYNIGDKNPSTHMFYFNTDGEDDVYTVPTLVGRSFENYPTAISLMDLPKFHYATIQDMTEITVEKGGKKTDIIYLADGDPSCYSEDYKWFLREGGKLLPLSEEDLMYFLSAIEGMGMQSGSAYAPTAKERAPYGLDKDFYTLGVSYVSASRGPVTDIIYIGQGDDGKSYARTEGSDVIGVIINKFDYFDFDYSDYRPHDFFKMHQETVDSMTVVTGDNRYAIKAEHQTETDEKGNETVTSTFTFGGAEIPEEYMTSFFNTMRSAKAEGEAPADAVPGKSVMDISFVRNTESHKNMELHLYEYDSSFYISDFNGQRLLINKLDVQEMLKAFSDAAEAAKK